MSDLIVLCGHSCHTHHGPRGGRCRACGATWCTLVAYACELAH